MNDQSRPAISTVRQPQDPPTTIRVSVIVTTAVAFTIGILTTLLLLRIIQPLPEFFSASSLIVFIFGIALSAAAIVLSVAAISLGKASEQAMIERSDESIRLQNEVFARTTDALQRIKSSTGVTEKRIEDIISGRAGAISDRIVDRLLETREVSTKNRKALERDIR